jgi:hypothetical protein
MSRELSFPYHRVRVASGVALPLCLLLAACGGGGASGIDSPPPPPTPTPSPTPTPTPTPTPGGTVDGDRTPASAIPVSGTATYDALLGGLLSSSGTFGIPFTLTADFGRGTISTKIDQDYRYDPTRDTGDDPIVGIHVSGSAPFTNDGAFDIPLRGTVNYQYSNSPTTPAPEPVTGDMDGAFFGPHAEEVGGTFDVERRDGTLLLQSSFEGQQRPH